MRTLNFRAWSNEYNRYCDFVTLDENGRWVGWIKSSGVYLTTIDIVIEQYTGLKDKNGKEIYEGDIVKRFKPHEFLKGVEETEIFRIRWGVRKAGFFAYSKERKKHSMPAKRLNANDVYEVIDNIHENGKLL